MTSKGRSHDTGDVRMRTNAYGHRKVAAMTLRFKTKEKPHTVRACSNPTSKRKGMSNTGGAYDKSRHVGRRTGRKA